MKRIIAMLFVLLMLTACVPTPDEETVMNKSDGVLEETIQGTPMESYAENANTPSGVESMRTLKSVIGAPDKVQKTLEHAVYGGTLTVDLDAAVHVPDVTCVPVCLVERWRPNAAEKQRLAEILSGETVFYDTDPIGKDRFLNEAKAYREALEALDQKPYGEQADYDAIRADYNETIERLMDAYRSGSNGELHPWNGDWEGDNLLLYTESGAVVSILCESKDDCSITYYAEGTEPKYPVLIDGAQVREQIEQVMAEVGNTHHEIIEIRPADETFRERFDSPTGIDDGSFTVRMQPTYAGIPVRQWAPYYGSDTAMQQAKVTYSHTAIRERIGASIRKGELYDFDWQNPIKILETANENVQLLPFDEILQIFEQQIFMNIYFDGDRAQTLRVTDIDLSYRCVAKRDSDLYYLLPVWSFVGLLDGTQKDASKSKLSFLTVNAIDGSIINDIAGF